MQAGELVWLDYGEVPQVVHGRLLLAHLVNDWYVGVTPDGHVYPELYNVARNGDIVAIHRSPAGGGAPPGVPPGALYGFAPFTAAQLHTWTVEAQTEAAALQAAGYPGMGDGGGAGVGAGAGALGGGGGGPAAAGAGAGGGGGAIAAALAAGAIVGAAPPVVGGGAGGGGGVAGGGAAFGAAGAAPGAAGAGPAGGGAGGVLAGGAAAGAAPVVGAGGAPAIPTDIRTLAVKYDNNGDRKRTFQSAVELISEDPFADYPISGPRTLHWGLKFMAEHGGTPNGWHQKWKSEMKLQSHDGGVEGHETACRLLEMGSCYDQLNLGNCAIGEGLMREVMCTEERYKDRASSSSDGRLGEKALFQGHSQRHALCIHPELITHISSELSKEASILKERRKAREERALLKPEKPEKAGK